MVRRKGDQFGGNKLHMYIGQIFNARCVGSCSNELIIRISPTKCKRIINHFVASVALCRKIHMVKNWKGGSKLQSKQWIAFVNIMQKHKLSTAERSHDVCLNFKSHHLTAGRIVNMDLKTKFHLSVSRFRRTSIVTKVIHPVVPYFILRNLRINYSFRFKKVSLVTSWLTFLASSAFS